MAQSERRARPIYLVLGWVFFSLGAVGVVLPLLPTTPFMVLALWAFSRGSVRFEQWLYHHPVFDARAIEAAQLHLLAQRREQQRTQLRKRDEVIP